MTHAESTRKPDISERRWLRNAILFLGGQAISLFGSALVQYAIMWKITLDTESGLMMTIYIICGFVPTFLLSPFAGVWADRYNRKFLIIAADSLIAIATLVLAVLFYNGYHAMWLFFVIAAIRAVGTGIQTPAVGAILPQIVPQQHLTKVNGVNGSIQALVTLVSPMMSAALWTITGIEVIFLIDVVTATIAVAILLLLIRIPAHEKAAKDQQPVGYIEDLKLGIQYIRNHKYLQHFFIFMAVFFVMAAPAAFLTPLQVARSFGDDVWRLTAIEIAFSVGMMLGGALIAVWGGFRNKMYTIALGAIMMGVCTFALGVIPIFWIYLIVMSLFGVVMPLYNTPATVLLQEKVDPDYLGRVFGVMGMITTSMMPIGMLIFGPIADYVEIEWLLIGTGIILTITAMLILRNRSLIEAGMPLKQQPSKT